MKNFIEKRAHPRYDVIWPVTLSVNQQAVKGQTINISYEGISVECDEPLPLNKVINISIEPLDSQAIAVSGKVVWSDIYGIAKEETSYGLGICFVEISEQDRVRYNDLVSTFLDQ